MNAYEVLAIVGGITGPAASVAEVWSISRDRPRLRFDIGFTTSIAREPRMWLDLYNDGRQPLTVREAGLYGSRFPVEINSQERGLVQATAFYTFKLVTAPLLIDPGHHKRFEGGVPDSVTYGYHVDFPLRAYAIDARGRWIWAKAAPLVRMMLGDGPRPASIDAAMGQDPHAARDSAGCAALEGLGTSRAEARGRGTSVLRRTRRGDKGRLKCGTRYLSERISPHSETQAQQPSGRASHVMTRAQFEASVVHSGQQTPITPTF